MCITSLSTDLNEDGLHLVTPDVGINGLIYALPKNGDHIIMFSMDLKNTAPKSKSNARGPAKKLDEEPRI